MLTEVSNTSNEVTLSLTKEQMELILESLLYAGSINIGSDWDERTCQDLIETAICLKKQTNFNFNLKNLTYFEDEGFEDEFSSSLKTEFNIESFTVKNLDTV